MSGPLDGVRVLDLTRFLAGPYCTMLLADLGAEVLKIEPPSGDESRWQQEHRHDTETAYYLSVNRNKQGLVLDLKHPLAAPVVQDLVRCCDVVVNNYRPGVAERLGVDHDTLAAVNPRIITCSISAFGPDGPYRDRPAYDPILQAMGGGMSITGEPDRPPVRIGFPIGDLAGAQFAVTAIIAALYERERSGRGQAVRTSLLASQIALHTYHAAYYWHSGRPPGRLGTAHATFVPWGAMQTADGNVVIVAHTPTFFRNLSQAIGRPELPTDPRFANLSERLAHRAELMQILEPIFRTRTTAAWMQTLIEHDVPAGPVQDIGQALSDPGTLSEEMVVDLVHSHGFPFKVTGNPMKFSRSRPGPFTPPPTLGQHTDAVLQQLLGYPPERIAELRDAGALGGPPGSAAPGKW